MKVWVLFTVFVALGHIAAKAESFKVSVSIKQNIDGKTTSHKGALGIANFPKTVSENMSLNATIYLNGKTYCTGKIRTQGYQAYFTTKCNGKTFKGSASINRTLKIPTRTINFIKNVKLKSGSSFIEITTGNSTGSSVRAKPRENPATQQTSGTVKRNNQLNARNSNINKQCYMCKGINITDGKYCLSPAQYGEFIADSYLSCKKI